MLFNGSKKNYDLISNPKNGCNLMYIIIYIYINIFMVHILHIFQFA